MPVQQKTQGTVGPPNKSTNGLASLMTSYGDSSSGSSESDTESSDSETESQSIPDKVGTGINGDCGGKISTSGATVLNPGAVAMNEDVEIIVSKQPDQMSFKDIGGNNDGENEEDEVEVVGVVVQNSESFKEVRVKEEPKSDDSSSDTQDSESDSDESEDEAVFYDASSTGKDAKKRQAPRVKGEQGIYDLPPIEDLHISVPHEQCQPIGVIKSVVEPLVVVEAFPLTPALDIDSVLFLEEGDRALGHVFDVFGQVKQPHYCVRFNSKDHIDSKGIQPGMKVYCAPRTQHTSYVLIAQLKQMKGTDASWKHDIEPPPGEQEFSDDEMERMAKRGGRRGRARARNNRLEPPTADGDVIPSGPRPQGWKRPYGQESPYVPAHVSGFGPPSRGFGHGYRGRGFGRGGGAGQGSWNWPGQGQPQPRFGQYQHQRYPYPSQAAPQPYYQYEGFEAPPPPPPYPHPRFQQQQSRFPCQYQQNYQAQPLSGMYNQAPPPPPSPAPNGPPVLPNPFLSAAGSTPPMPMSPRTPIQHQPRFQNGAWSMANSH